jgi:hypothetical protein
MNVRGLVVVVVAATALVALTGVFLGSGTGGRVGSASPPPLPGPGPSLWDVVESIPPRAFRDRASRRKLIRELEEASVAADRSMVVAAEIQLARMRRHADGCDSEFGTADADDWVVDCFHQVRLRSEIERSIENLRR